MTELPEGAAAFLERAGWPATAVRPLPGDASFRRYYRIWRDDASAMLMHAPPPHEDPAPFLHVGRWLLEREIRAPMIIAEDAAQGFILLEDFGDDRLRERLDADSTVERAAYGEAVDALIALQGHGAGPFPPYDFATYMREVDLLVEWFCPANGLEVDRASWTTAWAVVLEPLLERQQPGVTVLRDYHAENIMLPPAGGQGIIDFQDALVGHRAYDLVSLLQDARRDVAEELESAMLDRYIAAVQPGEDFRSDYARLGAQRNAKIIGIFARLDRRDGKPRYLSMIPRVWELLQRDLRHPALRPVADWFASNIPPDIRRQGGGALP
ncbi:aminoglycoside phosphotransferase family protein [Porphyrobacter sp. GA68]|uniref:aminoglycoside phosphotransferase family protein n=1 Tax=Porphyrobacter sp. GA68 TaxID=2883480 RepID=UPI001D192D04|nr:phosphotransferase [Porphyrobacter sp. GA68]